MGERGSFVTSFIYCPECREAVHDVLLESSICKTVVDCFDGKIFGGFLKAMPGYPGEELVLAEHRLLPKLREAACHKVRLAVLADNGESKIFKVWEED